jgi:hypothetical protein
MPRQSKRQPRLVTRAVISVSLPLKPDWVEANRAAGIKNESLSGFIREAVRQRAERVLAGGEQPGAPLEATG